ncbi:MAG: glycosyltransferase family 2 protein, partial [Actinomycetota bacterium]|nr:glycosyltransferase family 2 protein [Actinomycetota bacterium]
MSRVVITMPAYRAEATVEKTVAAIPPGTADELILVDDASPDRTAEIARSLGIKVHVHPQNRGYGGNQKTCYTMAIESAADVVVMLHPDYQYEPKSVPLLIAPILAGEADMTFGSRFAGLGDPMAGGMPLYRFVGNRVTTTLENLLLGSRFSEMHSGMRAYTRRCLLSLPFLGYSEDFGFDTQFMVDAVTSGLRVVEVPIPTRYTKESSSISIVKSLKYVAHSLVHTSRQFARRGRRGRRYPVARARGIVPRDQSPAVPGRIDAGAALDLLRAYVLPGNRVLQVDAAAGVVETPLAEGWTGLGARAVAVGAE